uniref:TF-B3 domain-containing protein n=1 Tax=Tetradesmus obliquus TaxID=3088 RepID=A0A383W6Z4_TETOB|eukprot:jgi/Sobl393_1/10251/SZX72764.1
MAGKRLQDIAASGFAKSSYALSALCDLESKPFLQATGRHRSDHTAAPRIMKRRSSSQLPMHNDSVLQQQPNSTSSSQQEHGSLYNHMPGTTSMQVPMAPTAAAAATPAAGMRTQLSAATRCRQHSDDGEEVTSLPSRTAAAAAAVAAAFATADDAAAPAAAATTQPATPSPSATAAAAASITPQQQQEQQQQQQAPTTPSAAALPAGCRVLLSKALTRSDANAKRVILRCKQVEASLGSRPVGQGHRLAVGLPCGGSCQVMVRAWANGSNAKPMYVLEQVDQLFRQQQLAAGDSVSLLVSADGRQHFLRWQRAGEAAEQLPEAAAAAAAAAAAEPVEAAAAATAAAAAPAAVVEAAVPAAAAQAAAEAAVKAEPLQLQQVEEPKKQQQQQQQAQSPLPVQPQMQLAVQPQQQVPLVQAVPAQVLPDVVAAPEQQQQQQQQQAKEQQQLQQQVDDQDAALLLLPLVGGSAMDYALRTGCYLLCLQQGCVQPACLGCMGCCLHKRRRVA